MPNPVPNFAAIADGVLNVCCAVVLAGIGLALVWGVWSLSRAERQDRARYARQKIAPTYLAGVEEPALRRISPELESRMTEARQQARWKTLAAQYQRGDPRVWG